MNNELPDFNPTLHEGVQGVYRKYDVRRLNDPTGKHTYCEYFVLDLTHDKHAKAALAAYVDSCKSEFPVLADDLRKRYGDTDPMLPDDMTDDEVRDDHPVFWACQQIALIRNELRTPPHQEAPAPVRAVVQTTPPEGFDKWFDEYGCGETTRDVARLAWNAAFRRTKVDDTRRVASGEVTDAMVERGCRAICSFERCDPDERVTYSGTRTYVKPPLLQWQMHKEDVRVALEAVLNIATSVSDEFVCNCTCHNDPLYCRECKECSCHAK